MTRSVPRGVSLLLLLLTTLLLASCATGPVVVHDPEAPAAQALVNLRALDPSLRFDIRYATANNFTGQKLYPMPGAWLTRDAAEALRRVQQDLGRSGLGLKVFDGYRPLHVQQQMWDLIRDERYVSNPAKNAGRHTRGTAVDVTLVDRNGRELPMPTAFDDFTIHAHRGAKDISPTAERNSRTLEAAMVKHGFVPYPFEWWHFDFRGWEKYPPMNVPLNALATGSRQNGSR